MNSKRSAFRLPIPQHKVTYKTTYVEGEASLLNISTDGCAFESPSVSLFVGEKILVTIKVEDTEKYVELRSLVAWIYGDIYGIKFTTHGPST